MQADRFGVLAAFGRQPSPREMERMVLVERCAKAFWGRHAAEDEAEWANANPTEFELLMWIERLTDGK